ICLLFLGAPRAKASIPSEYVPASLVSVFLEKGDTLMALAVEPAPYQTLRITTPDGTYRYLSANRVLRIRDGYGADRTSDVLERRQTVGRPLPRLAATPPSLFAPARIGPRSKVRAFPVTEGSLLLGAHATNDQARADHHWYFGCDVGLEQNISARNALGFSMFVGSGNDYADLGLRARFRRWLGDATSVELAPGIIIAQDEYSDMIGRPPGWVARLGLFTSSGITLTAQGYTIRRGLIGEEARRETGFMAGLTVGGPSGMITGALATFVALGQFATEPHVIYRVPSPL
ncbi:MAG TPA: hypothetical protein VF363_12930, partial [Candidatus Eisenbacteria bacterium]